MATTLVVGGTGKTGRRWPSGGCGAQPERYRQGRVLRSSNPVEVTRDP